MPTQTAELSLTGLIPEPEKNVWIVILSNLGVEINRMELDFPVEPIYALIGQVLVMSEQAPKILVINEPLVDQYFTIVNWDPEKRILTVRLKK